MSEEILAEPIHVNGEASTAEAAVWDPSEVYSVLVQNTHDSNDLYVSFDGGTHYYTIKPEKTLSLRGWANVKINLSSGIVVKASKADTGFKLIILK